MPKSPITARFLDFSEGVLFTKRDGITHKRSIGSTTKFLPESYDSWSQSFHTHDGSMVLVYMLT